MSIHTITSQVGSTPIVFETGKMGKLADGAVTVRCGDTIVFVSAVSATSLKPGQDWFPLSVEYKEKPAPPADSPVVISSGKVVRLKKKSLSAG